METATGHFVASQKWGLSGAAGQQGWLWVTRVAKAGRVRHTAGHREAETGHGWCMQRC